MKKLLKRISLLLVCALTAATFAACGSDHVIKEEDTTDLYVMILERGYGTEWLKQLEKGFEAKYPGVDMHVDTTPQREVIENSIGSGEGFNDTDIYFDVYSSFYVLENSYRNLFPGYEHGLYDLTDIFDSKIPGEGDTTLGGKMFKYVYENFAFTEDGETAYYCLPWATAPMGLYYNADVFKAVYGENYESHLPKTTGQLRTVAEEIKKAGKVPFTYPGQLDQWYPVIYTWWAQYEGLDSYNRFYEGKALDPITETYVTSKEIYAQQGRLKALEELQYFLDADKGYHESNVNDYGASNFRMLQARFVTKDMPYAMYPCGDWLAEESKDSLSADIRMMKTPVLSSIDDRLASINGETELLEVISYVDGEITELSKEYDENDIEEVRKARNMTYTRSQQHFAYVPAYTNAEQLVKDFFLYMASDEAIAIYKDYVNGGFLPFTYDYSGAELSSIEMSISEILEDPVVIIDVSDSPLFVKGGLGAFPYTLGTMDAVLGASKTSAIYKDAYDVWKEMQYSDEAWRQIVSNSGL